jgi:hypothetical protein
MTMPPGWFALAVGEGEVDALLGLLGSQQPEVADVIRSYLEVSGGRVSMVGLDTDPDHASGGIPPVANVLIQPNAGLTLDFSGFVVAQVLGQLPGVTGDVTRESVVLPAGEAIRLRYAIVTAGGSGQTVALTTYLTMRGAEAFLFTFATPAEQEPRDSPVFDAMMQSVCFEDCP